MNNKKQHALEFGRIKHIHFVGIGGAGMCGIAEEAGLHTHPACIAHPSLSRVQADFE